MPLYNRATLHWLGDVLEEEAEALVCTSSQDGFLTVLWSYLVCISTFYIGNVLGMLRCLLYVTVVLELD